MKRKPTKPKADGTQLFAPARFDASLEEKVIFSGNLTTYYHEVTQQLKQMGSTAMLTEGNWEIPQMVGLDRDDAVAILVFRTFDDDDFGEGEFLVSSLDNQWIMHLSYFSSEDDFFKDCLSIAHDNFDSFRWLSFVYDEDGRLEGLIPIEKSDTDPGESPNSPRAISRKFTDD